MGFLSGGLGAITGALSGLASGALNNYYNKKAQSAQNEVQWQMWQANNDYNSPQSVMSRLEEAGLNPNLVYGNGGASYQATMPTASKRAPAGFDINAGFNPVTFQQLENMEAQNDLIGQQGRNAKVQEQILKNQNRIAKKDADIYESTGIRPGDSAEKTIMKKVGEFINQVKEHNVLDVLHGAWEYQKKKWDNDLRRYSQNNSSNVKFYD